MQERSKVGEKLPEGLFGGGGIWAGCHWWWMREACVSVSVFSGTTQICLFSLASYALLFRRFIILLFE